MWSHAWEHQTNVAHAAFMVIDWRLVMRIPRFLPLLSCTALALSLAPAAAAGTEATPSDVWSAAASLATATIYRPSGKVLNSLKLYGGPPRPDMTCVGEWNIEATYNGDSFTQGGEPAIFELYQSTSDCARDPGANNVEPNTSSVKVANANVDIDYFACFSTPQGQDDPAEGSCAVADRIYHAFGTLPAAGGKKPTRVAIESRGLPRAQVEKVIRSLRRVG